jgi:pimeloyl-ACP methyl ester carboxylesterase
VLFVHGGHSNCRETLFHKGFDHEKFRLITPTRPGYGDTPLNNHRTPSQTANLFRLLLDELQIEQAIVYGISAGGLTAISLAAEYPERVTQLILASAVTKKWLNENDKIYKAAQKIFNPTAERFTWGMVKAGFKIFPQLMAKSFYKQFTTNPPHDFRDEDIQLLASTMKHFRSQEGFLNDIDQNIAEDELSSIKCPTLIIHSKNDASVPFEHAMHANNLIEDSRLIPLENEWGHLFWIGEDSRKSITQVIQFINE